MLEFEGASIKPKFQKESEASLLPPVIINKNISIYMSIFISVVTI